jgi:hypothetical protein
LSSCTPSSGVPLRLPSWRAEEVSQRLWWLLFVCWPKDSLSLGLPILRQQEPELLVSLRNQNQDGVEGRRKYRGKKATFVETELSGGKRRASEESRTGREGGGDGKDFRPSTEAHSYPSRVDCVPRAGWNFLHFPPQGHRTRAPQPLIAPGQPGQVLRFSVDPLNTSGE